MRGRSWFCKWPVRVSRIVYSAPDHGAWLKQCHNIWRISFGRQAGRSVAAGKTACHDPANQVGKPIAPDHPCRRLRPRTLMMDPPAEPAAEFGRCADEP